ncbi:restriction endonuclease subunit S [Phocaeicola oris]|uniref:restriction endonuclease subunit S n=1 Tax=Phocaeicola oris TaxID=2896850 RepID=UPI00234E8125|nr:restriction endonuclease subunit S [Phocaeicola oris]MCE2617124.1 restriction endonuclease subunit S [Phocaeicola oris]
MEKEKIIIPKGWRKITIGECVVERGKSPIKVDDAANYGWYPFFTSGEAVLQHDCKLVDGENIYLATGGMANVKYFNGEAAYSTDTYVLGAKEDICPKFMFYILLFLKQYIDINYFQGSGLKHLQKKDFKRHEIIIPKSKDEQQRIADALSKLDDTLLQTQSLIDKYELIKRGLMQDLLSRGIDSHGNVRREKTHKFKDSPLGRIPEEWECKTIKEIYSSIKSGITPSRSVSRFFESGIYPWTKTLDLNEGEIYKTDEYISEFCMQNTPLKLQPEGSVLIAMYGGWIQIGRTAILKMKSGINQAICALSSPRFDINPYYTLYYLQQNRLRWRRNAVSIRKDPNITKKNVEEFYISFPSSSEEQHLIVEAIQDIITFKNKHSEQIKSLQNQKQGLLSDLITGRVRI